MLSTRGEWGPFVRSAPIVEPEAKRGQKLSGLQNRSEVSENVRDSISRREAGVVQETEAIARRCSCSSRRTRSLWKASARAWREGYACLWRELYLCQRAQKDRTERVCVLGGL